VGPKVCGTILDSKEDPNNKLKESVLLSPMARVDRSVLEGKSIVMFRAAIKSQSTLDPYERRLCNFLSYAKMDCDRFVSFAIKNPGRTERMLIEYSVKDKDRVYTKDPKQKLAACTVVNRIKPVKLLLDTNFASWW
jgi:hypothetical protein